MIGFPFTNPAFMASAHVAPPPLVLNELATDWSSRVQTYGGDEPSFQSLLAASNLCDAFAAAEIINKIEACLPVAPDSLIAAITPLIVGTGNGLWTNNNFVSGDLTVNGLAGDGASKYLSTGVIPNVAIASEESAGLVLYFHSDYIGTLSSMDLHSQSGDNTFGLMQLNGYVHADIWDASTGRLMVASQLAGYLASSRVAVDDFQVYHANSTTAHAAIAATTELTTGVRHALEMLAFCMNYEGTPTAFSAHRLSFIMILKQGLTESESSAAYNAIQAYRQAVGGGYV
jgi:hypothetical protein